jgi:hypothetical protein
VMDVETGIHVGIWQSCCYQCRHVVDWLHNTLTLPVRR